MTQSFRASQQTERASMGLWSAGAAAPTNNHPQLSRSLRPSEALIDPAGTGRHL